MFQRLHPHSLMMHTHRHGKVVSAWRVRRDLAGRDQWTLLDKRNPTKAQHYYPIQDPTTVLRYGDTMAFRYVQVRFSQKGSKSLPTFTSENLKNKWLEEGYLL